jgi:hypothetical protein
MAKKKNKTAFDGIDFAKLIKLTAIDKIKPNPDNPRIINKKEYAKLLESIKRDPELLMVKPLVIDKNNVIVGGNQRYDVCNELGMENVPTIDASMLTPEQIQKFIVIDNTHAGDWDWVQIGKFYNDDQMAMFGLVAPISKDELPKKELNDNEFDNQFSKHNDTNCELPIVPEFHEKYAYFIVLTTNEIDEEFIRNKFGLNVKHTSHKSTDDRLSNVIPFKKLMEVCTK